MPSASSDRRCRDTAARATYRTSVLIGCPGLHPSSPRGPLEPKFHITLFRDGQPVHDGCGEVEVGPGVYRVRVDITPHHLMPFLGSDPARWVRRYPWLYSNALRVEAT